MKTWIVWGCTSPDLYVRAENIFDALKKAREIADDYLGAQELSCSEGWLDLIVDLTWVKLTDHHPMYCNGHTDKYASEEIVWSIINNRLTVWTDKTHQRVYDLRNYSFYLRGR